MIDSLLSHHQRKVDSVSLSLQAIIKEDIVNFMYDKCNL